MHLLCRLFLVVIVALVSAPQMQAQANKALSYNAICNATAEMMKRSDFTKLDIGKRKRFSPFKLEHLFKEPTTAHEWLAHQAAIKEVKPLLPAGLQSVRELQKGEDGFLSSYLYGNRIRAWNFDGIKFGKRKGGLYGRGRFIEGPKADATCIWADFYHDEDDDRVHQIIAWVPDEEKKVEGHKWEFNTATIKQPAYLGQAGFFKMLDRLKPLNERERLQLATFANSQHRGINWWDYDYHVSDRLGPSSGVITPWAFWRYAGKPTKTTCAAFCIVFGETYRGKNFKKINDWYLSKTLARRWASIANKKNYVGALKPSSYAQLHKAIKKEYQKRFDKTLASIKKSSDTPGAGLILETWPMPLVQLSRVDRDNKIAELLMEADFSKVSNISRKTRRPFIYQDFTDEDFSEDEAGLGAALLALDKVIAELPAGAEPVLASSLVDAEYRRRGTFGGIKFGIADHSDEKSEEPELTETSKRKAKAIWVVINQKTVSGRSEEETVLIAEYAADEDGEGWMVNFDQLQRLGLERYLGQHLTFEMLSCIKPKDEGEHMALITLGSIALKFAQYAWWDKELFVSPDVSSEVNRSWAFTHFAKASKVDATKLVYVYAHLRGSEVSDAPLSEQSGALYDADEVKRFQKFFKKSRKKASPIHPLKPETLQEYDFKALKKLFDAEFKKAKK